MTLTEFSYYFRKTAPFAGLSVIVLFILYYGVQLAILLMQVSAPPAQVAQLSIDPKFGKIPEPYWENQVSSAGYTFELDTIDGVTVTATASAGVYFLPEYPARFRFRENVYLMAKTLGINTELTKYRLEGDIAVFSDVKNRFSVNIKSYNFDYEYLDLASERALMAGARIPSENDIRTAAVKLMTQLGRYPGELARGTSNIIYLAYNAQTGEMVVVDNPNNANLVEVDFYRENIGEFPVATPRYFNSHNYVIMAFPPDSSIPKVIRARMAFFEKAGDQYGIYPVKNGDQAFLDLQEGRGYVVSAGEGMTNVAIKRMFMAYFDPDIRQDYLQPVYVFLGDSGFVAYVPAVESEYLMPATPSAAPKLDYSSTEQPAAESGLLNENSEETLSPTIEPSRQAISPKAADEPTPAASGSQDQDVALAEPPTSTPRPTASIRRRLTGSAMPTR